MYKIIGADGKEYGPITADQLRQWIAEGRANLQTQVLPDGATEWKAVGELPEFAALSPGTPGTVPVMPNIPAPGPAGAELVNGPAIGLIVVAILGVLLQITSLILNLAGASILASSRMPKDAWLNMFSGTISVVSSIIGILLSGVILLGAMKMKKLESYGLAMAASIIAMIPCFSPCCLLGLPIGIWAVVVLSKPEVKSAFH
jgi:GYF domain 2